MTSISTEGPHQPLHPSFIPLLDPDYVEFHNKHLINIIPPHTLPWHPSIRDAPAVPGSSEPLKVGKTQDYDLPNTKMRGFTPEGKPPAGGWPVFIFFHGGGWTLGNIGSETAFATNICIRSNCVVLSVDYRLAPENPYPAAVEDAIDSLKWVVQNGEKELNANLSKIAVGGSSSGGNLATILALKVIQQGILPSPQKLIFQLLIVPVTDNTASIDTSAGWRENALTPWLSPERMIWFRNNYLPNLEDHTKWDASPLLAPDELLKELPRTWIAVCERDILKEEGVEYGKKLVHLGVDVEVEVYKGAPHPIMAMDGVLPIGKKMITDAVKALSKAFLESS